MLFSSILVATLLFVTGEKAIHHLFSRDTPYELGYAYVLILNNSFHHLTSRVKIILTFCVFFEEFDKKKIQIFKPVYLICNEKNASRPCSVNIFGIIELPLL